MKPDLKWLYGDKTFDDYAEAMEARFSDLDQGIDNGPVVQAKLCDRCKAFLVLDRFTTTCPECGADYNMNGDLLADRSQWGIETGESWQDCI